ncbi:MAG: glycosyltransferase family 2 protein [Candidatus Aminicenantes bacterium]|nr:MAG: glycosyltransferase family 2 protein [Candidatus Aminicenantes bacterium]
MEKDLTIIIVNHNTKDHLIQTLDSLVDKIKGIKHEIVVVDNASTDGSVFAVKHKYPSVEMLPLDHNVGFAKANNEGIKYASGQYLLILNSDTEVPEGSVEKLIDIIKSHPGRGIVAPLIFNPDGSLQLSWGKDLHLHTEMFLKFFAERWHRWQYRRNKGRIRRNVDWVSGACFLIKHSLYRQIGGFDERFFLYVEDADLGKRVRQLGHKIHLTSQARIIHHMGQSVAGISGKALLEAKKSQLYYYGKHNSRSELVVLKFYLRFWFWSKRMMSRLRGDTKNQEIYARVLAAIREFRCEDPV